MPEPVPVPGVPEPGARPPVRPHPPGRRLARPAADGRARPALPDHVSRQRRFARRAAPARQRRDRLRGHAGDDSRHRKPGADRLRGRADDDVPRRGRPGRSGRVGADGAVTALAGGALEDLVDHAPDVVPAVTYLHCAGGGAPAGRDAPGGAPCAIARPRHHGGRAAAAGHRVHRPAGRPDRQRIDPGADRRTPAARRKPGPRGGPAGGRRPDRPDSAGPGGRGHPGRDPGHARHKRASRAAPRPGYPPPGRSRVANPPAYSRRPMRSRCWSGPTCRYSPPARPR